MYHKLPSGKKVKIDDNTIKNLMEVLDLTKEEAIQTYLEDEGELENEEQIELDKKAKNLTAVHDAERKQTKKDRKPRTVYTSDEKKDLFNIILTNLKENYENVEILKENKKIEVKINDKSFSIDIIQHRPPKN